MKVPRPGTVRRYPSSARARNALLTVFLFTPNSRANCSHVGTRSPGE